LVILVIAALYIAAGGWVRVEIQTSIKQSSVNKLLGPVEYEGVTFASEAARDSFIALKNGSRYFPWTFNLPYPVSLLITALSFAFLGGVIRILFEATQEQSIRRRPVFASLAFSAMSGLLVLGASYTIPAILSMSDVTVRPVVLLFLCLLGGLSAEHIFLRLEGHIKKALGGDR
jgi:hypothetical protein